MTHATHLTASLSASNATDIDPIWASAVSLAFRVGYSFSYKYALSKLKLRSRTHVNQADIKSIRSRIVNPLGVNQGCAQVRRNMSRLLGSFLQEVGSVGDKLGSVFASDQSPRGAGVEGGCAVSSDASPHTGNGALPAAKALLRPQSLFGIQRCTQSPSHWRAVIAILNTVPRVASVSAKAAIVLRAGKRVHSLYAQVHTHVCSWLALYRGWTDMVYTDRSMARPTFLPRSWFQSAPSQSFTHAYGHRTSKHSRTRATTSWAPLAITV